ncbi:MAG: SGNH/GDSL hydrolase family protein, partial [Pirellulales bacterium]
LVKKRMKAECWREWKGGQHGSDGGQTIRWADKEVDGWLKRLNPEVAVMMFGTNDIGQVPVEEYEQKTREVVKRCLKNGTVVILTTIPPRSGHLEASGKYAEAVRRVAREEKVPVVDYHRAILDRRKDDWDGSLPQFKERAAKDVYDVPTLISGDGVHPSYPKDFRDFSAKSLASNGYNLRSYLTLNAYAEVIRKVLEAKGSGK